VRHSVKIGGFADFGAGFRFGSWVSVDCGFWLCGLFFDN
jgi:hypothetical protein